MDIDSEKKRIIEKYLERFELREVWIQIANISICIRTNHIDKLFSKYFSEKMRTTSSVSYYLVNIIFVDQLDEELNDISVCGWRSKLMEDGFYISHYYGDSIKLFEDSETMYIFGHNSDQIFWRFGIKKILTVETYKKNSIHLKAAAITVRNKGYLMVSPGGGGKTTFLQALILDPDVKFISNTHVVIQEGVIYGLHANMRIRENGIEKYCSPWEVFSADKIESSAKLFGVLFLKGEKEKDMSICTLEKDIAADLLEYFAWGMGTYNLKMDVMECFDYDYQRFSQYVKYCRKKTECLLDFSCLFVNGDILIEDNRKKVLESFR